MFSVILYMLRKTLHYRASPLPFPSFPPLTVTCPKLAVILRPLYHLLVKPLNPKIHSVRKTAEPKKHFGEGVSERRFSYWGGGVVGEKASWEKVPRHYPLVLMIRIQ
jgi:hypothetical protein